jgi:purine-binding chemotaxis protein CheW
VSDIVTVPSDAMQPPPAVSLEAIVPFLEGLATVGDRMVMVLNLEAILEDAPEELGCAA